MAHLADTNVVFRRVLSADPQHGLVRSAVDSIRSQGEIIYACPQNMVEFHALATRPASANGLALTNPEARRQAKAIESIFPVLPDLPQIYPEWCALIDRYGATGRQVFDVRLVAVMLVHGITHLLTMDPTHFRRFTEITVVEPKDIIIAPSVPPLMREP
jgi:predicted nucleic acid-binding protein